MKYLKVGAQNSAGVLAATRRKGRPFRDSCGAYSDVVGYQERCTIDLYVCLNIYICIYGPEYMYIRMHMYVYVNMYMYIYVFVCMRMSCICIHICVYIHTVYICVYIYVHVYIYIYIYL